MTICDNIFDWEKQLFIIIMNIFESLTSCKLLCIFDKNCKSDTITSISETWCLSSSDNCILEGFLQRDLMIFRDNLIIWCWRHLSQQAIRPRHTYVLQMSKWWNRKQTFFWQILEMFSYFFSSKRSNSPLQKHHLRRVEPGFQVINSYINHHAKCSRQ